MNTLNKIFYLLKKKGLSEAEFARQLKISRSIISDWKKGRNKSYNKRLDKIAEILNVSVDYLLCDSDDPIYITNTPYTDTNNLIIVSEKQALHDKYDCNQVILNADEQKLIDTYRKLDDEGKVNVKHTAYSELRRMMKDGDRGSNKVSQTNN